MTKTNFSTYKIVLTAIFLALALVVNQFSPVLPLAGVPAMKISFNGPFLKFIAIIFGPVYGGIIAALADIFGFILKPTASFNPIFTFVAFCKGALIGLLWQYLKNIRTLYFGLIYNIIFSCLIFFGIINIYLLSSSLDIQYVLFLKSLKENVSYFTYGFIYVGILCILINIVPVIIFKIIKSLHISKDFITEQVTSKVYLKLMVAVSIPSLLGTFANTILLQYLYFNSDKNMFVLLIPRIAKESITVIINVYILMLMLYLYNKSAIKKKGGLN